MSKLIRKTAAVLLAAALVGGAAPAGYSGFTLNDTAVTASAAEVKTIAVGDVLKVGDKVDFGNETWIVCLSNGQNTASIGVEGVQEITYDYSSGNNHVFYFGSYDITITSDDPAVPDAIKVVSGDGTTDDPFMFKAVYDNAQAKAIAVGEVYSVGDSIDFGDSTMIHNDLSLPGGGDCEITGIWELMYSTYDHTDDHSVYFHLFNAGASVMIASENPAQPTGIRVVSGDGTPADPYRFEAVFDENQMSTIAVGDVFRIGDEIDFGGGYWFDWDSDVFGEGNTVGSGIYKLIYSRYHTGYAPSSGYHTFGFQAFESTIKLLIPSENTDVPVGIKVVKGSGTASDPFVFDVTYETSASFSTASLTLKDEIGLNFFIYGADAYNWEEFTVKFSGKCDEAGKMLPLSTKNGRFCATAHLTANNMGEEIRAELYKDGEKVHELTYSAYTYLKALEEENDMAAATLLYGLAAEDYFNGTDNSARIEEIGVRFVDGVEPFNAERLLSFANHLGADVTSLPENIRISAVLNAKTALRVYTENGDWNGPYGCYKEIRGLTPGQLFDNQTMNIDGTEYTFSAITWAYRALKNPMNETDIRTLNMAKAMTIYGYIAAQQR